MKKKKPTGCDALFDKKANNDHINWITWRVRYTIRSTTCRLRDTRWLKIGNTLNDPRMVLST